MGAIDFRTGDLSRKLGGLVGARWKQTPYVRRFVIPANPKTANQMLVRNAFAFLVSIARRINSTILKIFTIPKPKTMSGYNRFVQINKDQIDGGLLTYSTVKTASGGLYSEGITSATYTAPDTTVVVDWPTGLQGEALGTDLAIICVYNETQDTWGFNVVTARSVGLCDVTLGIALNDVVHAWLFFVQEDKISSESAYVLGAESA